MAAGVLCHQLMDSFVKMIETTEFLIIKKNVKIGAEWVEIWRRTTQKQENFVMMKKNSSVIIDTRLS